MDNEIFFDSYAEDSSNISDTAIDSEIYSVSDPHPDESEQGSELIMQDNNSSVVYELQRIEGYTISILYTLYIALALFFSVVIVRIIYHFTKFD